jgi:hypothetical protein
VPGRLDASLHGQYFDTVNSLTGALIAAPQLFNARGQQQHSPCLRCPHDNLPKGHLN